jgi:hypothetical protein
MYPDDFYFWLGIGVMLVLYVVYKVTAAVIGKEPK